MQPKLPQIHKTFPTDKTHKSESESEMSIAYSEYNYVQYVQSAAFWQPVVLQSSCPVMPVLTEHGLEIAGPVLRRC